jgi:hypothetical protein
MHGERSAERNLQGTERAQVHGQIIRYRGCFAPR